MTEKRDQLAICSRFSNVVIEELRLTNLTLFYT